MTKTQNARTADTERVYLIGQYRVIEHAVRDEMHPTRTTNTVYIVNDTTGKELFIRQNSNFGLALEEDTAWSLVSYNAQKGRI